MKNERILIVAAHPDDEILGCAGTVRRLIGDGFQAYTLLLGEGITSRYKDNNSTQMRKELHKLRQSAYKANKILGVKKVFMHDFPDNKFDTVSFLDIVRVIENIKKDIKPGTIFTHFEHDLNIDHQLTYKAVITASRPSAVETVSQIYSFEVPSSTNWGFARSFCPSLFYDITQTLKCKLSAVRAYNMELRKFPHPRSIEGIKLTAKHRGMSAGIEYAEAFECVRVVR